jgi:predicted RNase H-like HicB family nuclease
MTFEVELTQDEKGLYTAAAVAYPGVTATGRTEKEALGLLVEALERHLKAQRKKQEGRA